MISPETANLISGNYQNERRAYTSDYKEPTPYTVREYKRESIKPETHQTKEYTSYYQN